MNSHRYAQPHDTLTRLAHSQDRDKRHVTEELVQAVGAGEDVLVRAQTVFLLTLFPTTFTVDRSKITITERQFFKAGDVLSIRIEDILNVAAKVGPFFGSLEITTKYFNPDKPYTVDHFWRQDVLKIKRILQGYLIAKQQEIDCSKLSTPELSKVLDELGSVARPDRI